MLNKLVVTTPSTVTTSQPDTITIGPFPVSVVKSVSGSSQYQLVLPILNQQLTSSQNTVHVDEDICVLEEARLFLATLCNNVVNDILTGSGGIFVVLPVRFPFTPGVSC
jgi:hypothetical protein